MIISWNLTEINHSVLWQPDVNEFYVVVFITPLNLALKRILSATDFYQEIKLEHQNLV